MNTIVYLVRPLESHLLFLSILVIEDVVVDHGQCACLNDQYDYRVIPFIQV